MLTNRDGQASVRSVSRSRSPSRSPRGFRDSRRDDRGWVAPPASRDRWRSDEWRSDDRDRRTDNRQDRSEMYGASRGRPDDDSDYFNRPYTERQRYDSRGFRGREGRGREGRGREDRYARQRSHTPPSQTRQVSANRLSKHSKSRRRR